MMFELARPMLPHEAVEVSSNSRVTQIGCFRLLPVLMVEAWSVGKCCLPSIYIPSFQDANSVHVHINRGADKTVKYWDISQRSCLSTTQTGSPVWAVAWQPLKADQSRVGKEYIWGGEEGRVNWMRAAGSS